MGICRSCGFNNSAGIKFCGECGRRLHDAWSTPQQERKIVTVLFCDLVGFTSTSDGADPEDIQARLSAYHSRARAEIERFGGVVEKFIGDAVMAAFGAPIVHEDDAERAVRAGLALLRAVDELNNERQFDLSVRIGIATGEAVVTTDSRPEQGEGMLAGDVVNTAARLQTAAPVGAVLVGQSTRDATLAAIEYGEHKQIEVKGKADPLSVWVAMKPRGSVGEALADRTTPMIGRLDELGVLQRLYARAARERTAQLVTIVGDPGLGKSRLVQSFSDWIDDRDELVTWRQGRCSPYGESVSFAALAQIVMAQVGVLETDAPSLRADKLAETVHHLVGGTELVAQEHWLVARLSPLLSLPSAEVPQEELFVAWQRFLRCLAATGQLVIIIEDVHWADAAVLSFLEHVLDRTVGVPMLIIATARPELFDREPDWGANRRNNVIVRLAPLEDVETAQLVASLLGAETLPSKLHAAVLGAASGNPLYVREFVNLVVAQNATNVDAAAGAPLDADIGMGLPMSVRQVIAARLDSLEAEPKRMLHAASVVGHTFWAGALAHLTAGDVTANASTLDDLERRDYLRRAGTSRISGEGEYIFTHALIADVAYQQLPRSARASYHEKAGDWHANLVERSGGEGQSAVIAQHYTQAYKYLSRDADRSSATRLARTARDWHMRAARQAMAMDPRAAEAHVNAGLDLTESTEFDRAHAQLLELRADVYVALGRAGDADASYRQAHREYAACGDEVAAAVVDLHHSDILTSLARTREAVDLVRQALTVLEQGAPGAELLEAYVATAGRDYMAGRNQNAIALAERALQLAATLPDAEPRHVCRALRIRGSARLWSAQEGAEEDLNAALELATAHNLTPLLVNLFVELGNLKFFHDSSREAIPFHERACELARDRGQTRLNFVSGTVLANDLLSVGRLAEAVEMCAHYMVVGSELDLPGDLASLRQIWADAALVQGDFERATSLIAQVLPMVRDDPTSLPGSLITALACMNGASGSPTFGSADLMAELVSAAQDPAAAEDICMDLPGLARSLCPAGHADLVRHLADISPSGFLIFDLSIRVARAAIAESDGDLDEAIRLYLENADQWASYGDPLECAHAHLGVARCLIARGERAHDQLTAARDLLNAIGAVPLLAKTESLLREVD